MLPDNNWYGHRYILLKYLGLKDRKVYAWIQHGWAPQILEKMPGKKKSKKYPLLFWSKFNQTFYNKKVKSYAIGSPFLYLCKILNNRVNKIKSKGTLVFPVHTSQDFIQKPDHEELIRKVKRISSGPYTACFYYRDLKKENIMPYKKNGWKIISCVNRNDNQSLFKLFHEINKNDKIICSEFTTALFYAMYLKKQTKVILGKNLIIGKYEKFFINFFKKKYPELFRSFLSKEKGHKLAKIELGYENIKNKNELKNLLGLDSINKKIYAFIFSKIYDLIEGSAIRTGKDLSARRLKKYISKARGNDRD